MPTFNAAPHLARSLAPLVPAVADGLVRELIVSDGGSNDDTIAIAEGVGARIVTGRRARGAQLIAGAAAAKASWLLFLHADTALADDWCADAARFLAQPENGMRAGAFRFAFDDSSFGAHVVTFWVAVRNRMLALPYGDQGLLISRAFYDSLGGYRDLPLMEDVDFVRRIGRARLLMLNAHAVTSAEKYRRDGFGKRSRRNLVLVARYFMGANPSDLAKRYD